MLFLPPPCTMLNSHWRTIAHTDEGRCVRSGTGGKMDFELNEEQQQIKRTIREFAEAELRPHVSEWDEAAHFPVELRPKFAELGVMGVLVPEEYGGAGMGYVEYATIIEELARVDPSIGLAIAAHNSLGAGHLLIAASHEQKEKYLTPLARGDAFAAWGLTEPSSGSDASSMRTTAVRPRQGFIQAMNVLDGGRISIAALAVGIAQGAYEAALKYARERRQFGRPIAEFQAIQFKLADMATEIDAARLLTTRAAALKQAGKTTTRESSMAKLYASEVAVRVAEQSVQIHGGYGYIKDYPAEKYWRDSKLCTIGEGTSEIQRVVLARQLLRS